MVMTFPPREPREPKLKPERTGLGTAGLVCSILGLIFGLTFSLGLGLILCILGIVFGAVGKSTAGWVVGVVGVVVVPLLTAVTLVAINYNH